MYLSMHWFSCTATSACSVLHAGSSSHSQSLFRCWSLTRSSGSPISAAETSPLAVSGKPFSLSKRPSDVGCYSFYPSRRSIQVASWSGGGVRAAGLVWGHLLSKSFILEPRAAPRSECPGGGPAVPCPRPLRRELTQDGPQRGALWAWLTPQYPSPLRGT